VPPASNNVPNEPIETFTQEPGQAIPRQQNTEGRRTSRF
jgi:hypothetical protein